MDHPKNQKPFDEWNEHKKIVQSADLGHKVFYHTREIWWCVLGINLGVETDGKHEYFERPVLVVRKFNRDMFLAVPLTSKIRKGEFFCEVNYESGITWAFLSQLRVLSTKRLTRKIGMAGESDFLQVIEKLVSITKNGPIQTDGSSEAEATNGAILSDAKP